MRHPVSSLSIGDTGWIQIADFLICGTLVILFSIGLRRTIKPSYGAVTGPLMIGLAGVGLVGAGFFSTDPIYGYPTNLPLRLAQFTMHGHLHDFFSIFLFVCLPIAFYIYRRHFIAVGKRKWALYSLLASFAMLLTFFLAAAGFKQIPVLVNIGGLLQRLCISIGCAWIMMLAIHFLREPEIPA